ncbi:MAG: DUF4349 domain-containing protein [Fimbriimonadaceae bacterium]|nr:DUF4349 domain-containing protein [Fimbriimonadaceae bacterium]
MSLRDDLKAYIDGELNADRAEEVRRAIDADPQLQKEVEQLRFLGLEIRRLAAEPAVNGREAALAAVRRSSRPWWHPFSPAGRFAYAGALLVLLLGFALMQRPLRSQFLAATVASESAYMDAGAESVKMESGGMAGRIPAKAPADQAPAVDAPYSEGLMSGEGRSGPGASSATTPELPDLERRVIQTGSLSLRVENLQAALQQAEAIANALGGYVENQNDSGSQTQLPRGNMTLRVKSVHFSDAMNQLRALGEKLSESTNREDITRQYADIEGRLRALRAEEESYVTMLRAAKKVGELLEIKERLGYVRQELESFESQRRALANLSTLSTISLSMEQRVKPGQPEKGEGWAEDTWSSALNALTSAGRFLGRLVIFVFVFAPIWLPPVLLFWWLAKRAKAA